ncbi:hypothetical protein LCGC14_0913790 [marine sediment metagenome]|uniref:Uncharacterized protein n=1 Tax=marine sediment metagenome TaxID=412755 RepID=A0A0F9RBL6_9ZZZZ
MPDEETQDTTEGQGTDETQDDYVGAELNDDDEIPSGEQPDSQEAEAPSVEDKPAEPQPQGPDDELLNIAANLGWDETKVRAYGRNLEGAMFHELELRRQKEVEAVSAKGKEDQIAPLDPQFSSDEFDEKIVTWNKSVAETVNQLVAENAELRQSVQGLQGRDSEREAVRIETDFDAGVSGLGEAYESLLGKGPTRQLKQDSPEFAKRSEIGTKMRILHNGYQAVGRAPSMSELFSEAARIVLGNQSETIAREKIDGEIQKRRAQVISKPGGRQGKSLTGEERAARRLDEFYRDHDVAIEKDMEEMEAQSQGTGPYI